MATMAAAAVTAAGMTFVMMVFSVMITLNIGIIQQIAGNQASTAASALPETPPYS